jgi:hypothetical protein
MSMYADRAEQVGHTARDVAETVREGSSEVARTASNDAVQVAHAARDAGVDVAQTAKREAASVLDEATSQAHKASADVKQRVRDEVDRQHKGMVDRVDAFARELNTMAAAHPQTPAGDLVGMLAARSSTFAEYLGQHGPEAVLKEVQSFARKHPGTFIAAAVAAGFVVGRLGKGVWQSQRDGSGS